MGFKLLEKKFLKNINSTAYRYIHEKTKAQLIYFQNDDINKSFSISFKTIPYNDNGIFHILEHSVLCGSEKYPVKEPFVELIKGSFNTFINAMTFPDKTMYPVSSKNEEDLKLLMDIYLDAVFNPKLVTNDNILKQEGWHYHLEDKKETMEYRGVVYNEMKGVYSSVDEIIDMHISESLYENTPYQYSYGGKPNSIHSITQKEFVDTYKYNYHPSNSYITLYGNLDITESLSQIDTYLNKYDFKDYSDYKLKEQILKEEVTKEATYYNEDPKNKHYVAINYIIGKSSDYSTINSIDLIDEILMGNSNSPFRKYFIDNNICEDVYGYMQRDKLQVSYSVIFKNVEDSYVNSISKLYKEQLEKILKEKFDKEQIQAIINKNRFITKEEVNKVSSPKGVNYAIRALRNWLDNENPLDMFDYDYFIDILQNNLEENKFEKIAEQYLLNNNQKSIVLLRAENVKKIEDDLTDYQASLSNEEIDTIIEDTKKLISWQNSTDKKEDLEKIKSVDAKKINLKKPYTDTVFEKIDDINYAHYNIETNDILYSKFLFDITSFDKKQIQYASLLSYLLFNINTTNKTELEVAKEIDFNLGNISSSINIFKNDKTNNINIKFVISAKNLIDKTDKLSDILLENTLNSDFSNKQAIYNICLELKLMLESRFKNYSHSFINKRIASYNSLHNKISEYISGYDFYKFIENVLENFENNFEELQNILNVTKSNIFNKNALLINIVGNDSIYKESREHIKKYVNNLNNNSSLSDNTPIVLSPKEKNYAEAFYFDTLVQYVGVGYNINEYSGSLLVLRHILNYDYLWNSIRVKGGAYTAGLTINKYGEVGFWSYRDPNLKNTLENYFNVGTYIKNINFDDKTLNKYIIGTLNAFDQLLSPAEKAAISLSNKLTDSDTNLFDKLVSEIKNTTVDDLRMLANLFDNRENNSYKCIIGSKEIIEANKNLFSSIKELN